jgi:pimeloyl-ACP methyl ester carboxylesterase
MIELLDSVGKEKAIWVGHDWGASVVWNIASHHPERCLAVANLCVPYATLERGLDVLVGLVDRDL